MSHLRSLPFQQQFCVGDSEYILLTDIQHVFNLREDHCIAFIAQNLEAEQDFVDEDMDKYLVVDTHVDNSEFMSAAQTLKMIFLDFLGLHGTFPVLPDLFKSFSILPEHP